MFALPCSMARRQSSVSMFTLPALHFYGWRQISVFALNGGRQSTINVFAKLSGMLRPCDREAKLSERVALGRQSSVAC